MEKVKQANMLGRIYDQESSKMRDLTHVPFSLRSLGS